ncbi:MAG: hypothetical protein AB1664_00690 [Thermodesulfobacteriota bacterium]
MSFAIRTSAYVDLDDADGLKVINSAFSQAREYLTPRLKQYQRNDQLFNGFIDMTTRDPDRSNVFIPKIAQIIKTKVPRSVKALSGQRPYIPFTSRRQEFSDGVRVWSDYIDSLLEDGYWMPQLTIADMIAHVHGTAYVDFTPKLERYTKYLPGMQTVEAYRLALVIKAWAPWEVYPDPFATGLELPGQCRYLVKIQLASRRQIKALAAQGAYPGLDFDKLADNRYAMGTDNIPGYGNHPGLDMLKAIGINNPMFDADIGILMRYESDGRYIDSWNGVLPLRDVPNPYPCRCIHTARVVHGIQPHTQNQFHGTGDVKPNEILAELLNDMFDQAMNSWNLMDQPVTYYDKNAFSGPANQLVRTLGNKIPMDVPRDRRIQDVVFESFGHELPASHFNVLSLIRDFMDMGSQSTPISRGEISDEDPTATEIGLASERSADAQELDVRLSEHLTLRSFGRKLIDTVCSMASVIAHDIVERVGLERATAALMMNPLGIPGGINMTFKGSDRVQNMAMKQRQWLLLADKLMALGSTDPSLLSRKLVEVFGEDSPEVMQMIYSPQVRMMLDQFKANQDMQRQLTLKNGGGDRRSGTARQVGAESSQEIRNSARG